MGRQEDIEAMYEILEDFGLDINTKMVEEIVENYNGHKDACREMEYYAHAPAPSRKVVKDPKITELEAEIEAYRNFIRKKYGDVYIDIKHGEVELTRTFR